MGCICSKGIIPIKCTEKHIKRKKSKKTSTKQNDVSSRTEDGVAGADNGANDGTTRLILTGENDSTLQVGDEGEEKHVISEKPLVSPVERRVKMDPGIKAEQPQVNTVFNVRNGVDGSQIVAGWPPWLAAVAGEAIKGWIPRSAESFEKLDKIGQGTYSSVYRARDLDTGKIVAMKKVRFVNMDPESVRFMAREILILRRLDHPNVMKLECLVTSRASGNLYLIFEYMEHDLAGLAASPEVKFTEAQIKCYMQQLLRGLEHCHNRGVLHRDIKGANLLIDNNGNLKIGDFGLATFFRTKQKQPLTSRVVTLWYRPPELLLGATDYGLSVDMWSSGCILAELFAGKPIMPGRTEVEQLHKIFKLCGSPSEEYWKKSKLPHATIFKPQQPYKCCIAETFKDFPPSALKLLNTLLAVEPDLRGTSTSALQSEFFTSNPLPCDPSSLPEYPPSKELDAKYRNDEARRQKAGSASKGRVVEFFQKGSKESKALPAHDASAESHLRVQKLKERSSPESNGDKYNLEERGSLALLEPSRREGPSVQSAALVVKAGLQLGSQQVLDSSRYNSELMTERSYKTHGAAAQLSRFSNSVAARGSSRFDLSSESTRSLWIDERFNIKPNQLSDGESTHHLLGGLNSSYKDEQAPWKGSNKGSVLKKTRIHYSGPLLPPGGSIEEMLKEHERQIQQAVRKARLEQSKTKAYGGNGLTESFLHYTTNVQ